MTYWKYVGLWPRGLITYIATFTVDGMNVSLSAGGRRSYHLLSWSFCLPRFLAIIDVFGRRAYLHDNLLKVQQNPIERCLMFALTLSPSLNDN
jgi:hypothetical protein